MEKTIKTKCVFCQEDLFNIGGDKLKVSTCGHVFHETCFDNAVAQKWVYLYILLDILYSINTRSNISKIRSVNFCHSVQIIIVQIVMFSCLFSIFLFQIVCVGQTYARYARKDSWLGTAVHCIWMPKM